MDEVTFEMLDRINFETEEFEHIIPISILLQEKQMSLLGHILRLDDEQPEKIVSCDKRNMRLKASHKRRYGPRDHWWEDNIERAYNLVMKNEYKDFTGDEHFDKGNPEHYEIVKEAAEARVPPFGRPATSKRRAN